MPDWQLSYLVKENTGAPDSGTLYIDLPKSEQIGMLMVEFIVSNTSPTSRDPERTVLDVLKNVRVLMEGNKDVYNCQPEVGGYLALMQMGECPPYDIRERGETVIRLPIIFGRHLKDPEYLLDTAAYSSGVLELEYELNTTYETAGSVEYSVWMLRPTERLSPQGFIRSRIVNSQITSGTAGTIQVDLPTGLPWLRTGFRCYDYDSWLATNITDVDLNVDQGRLHIFDGRIEDLKLLNNLWYGSQIIGPRYWAMTYHGQYVQHLMCDIVRLHWSHMAAAAVVYGSSAVWSNRHQIQSTYTDDTTTTTERDYVITPIGGHLFANLTVGEFGHEPFPAPQHNEAFLEFDLGATEAALQVWVQEVVRGAL